MGEEMTQTPKVEKKEWTIEYGFGFLETAESISGPSTKGKIKVNNASYATALETALKAAVNFIDKSDLDSERYYDSYQEYQDALAKVDL